MMTTKLAVALSAAALVTGCATHQQTGALAGAVVGAAVLGPMGGVAAAHWALGVTGMIVGAVIGGEIGRNMDEKDKQHVAVSVEKNSTETWTSSKGVEMTAKTVEVTPEKKEVTITAGEKSEKTTVVKKQNKWVKE